MNNYKINNSYKSEELFKYALLNQYININQYKNSLRNIARKKVVSQLEATILREEVLK